MAAPSHREVVVLRLVPRRSRPSITPFAFGLLLAGVGSSAGCGDECDDVGASWCRGTAVEECYRSGGGGHGSPSNQVKSTDCSEDGLICSEESGRARCVLEEPRCSEKPGATAVCVGNVSATCSEGASHPVPDVDCSDESVAKHCVESDSTARCSPFPENCVENAPERCVSGRVLSCSDGIWIAPSDSGESCFGPCDAEGTMQCLDTENDRGEPTLVAAECTGQPGIWRPTGPACTADCSCTGEPASCYCQD